MHRREWLKTTTLAAVGSFALPKILLGETAQEGALIPEVDISRNHGHALELTLSDVVRQLRKTSGGGSAPLSIQGTSSHPHDLDLNFDQWTDLLVQGQVSFPSTKVFGHSHDVTLVLVEG